MATLCILAASIIRRISSRFFSLFYIAGIQSYFGGPGFYRFNGPAGAEVNVSNKRDIYFLDDFRKSGGIGPPGDGDSDQSAAGLDKLIDL